MSTTNKVIVFCQIGTIAVFSATAWIMGGAFFGILTAAALGIVALSANEE